MSLLCPSRHLTTLVPVQLVRTSLWRQTKTSTTCLITIDCSADQKRSKDLYPRLLFLLLPLASFLLLMPNPLYSSSYYIFYAPLILLWSSLLFVPRSHSLTLTLLPSFTFAPLLPPQCSIHRL